MKILLLLPFFALWVYLLLKTLSLFGYVGVIIAIGVTMYLLVSAYIAFHK